MSKLEEKRLSSTEYYKNAFLRIHEDEVLLPDQATAKRIVITHVGAVNVIALTDQKELLLVRQYRYPLGATTIETPAGKLDHGLAPMITAKCELEEETGYTCKSLELIGTFASAPGFTNEVIHHFFAHDLTKLHTAVPGDDDEFTEVLLVTKDQAREMIASGEIVDLKTIYAIQHLTLATLW